MAYDHRSSPLLVGITFRELMSTIFHAQDPRNRRVKWFAVNLSSTWSPPSPRDAHLAVSHSISQLCTWRESERQKEARKGGKGMKLCSLLYIWKGTAVNTVFLHVPPVFRSSVPKVYRTSSSTRSEKEKENNRETTKRREEVERFCGIRALKLDAKKKGKNGNCEVENWSGRAHLRAIVSWMTDLLTMLRDNFAR